MVPQAIAIAGFWGVRSCMIRPLGCGRRPGVGHRARVHTATLLPRRGVGGHQITNTFGAHFEKRGAVDPAGEWDVDWSRRLEP